MKDLSLYEKAYLPDWNFPIRIFSNRDEKSDAAVHTHWHEQIEIIYVSHNEAIFECNSVPERVSAGDVVVINSNDSHRIVSGFEQVKYHCIILDGALIKSAVTDACDIKYIRPITDNLILFKNFIKNDPRLIYCIERIIYENDTKDIGYELAIKSQIYGLFVLLIRGYIDKILTKRELETRYKNASKMDRVLEHINENFSERITVTDMADLVNLSEYYFCHLFKRLVGSTMGEYVNRVRIEEAENLLKSTGMYITEVALSCGFSDVNYFCRVFKKYKKMTPSEYRKNL